MVTQLPKKKKSKEIEKHLGLPKSVQSSIFSLKRKKVNFKKYTNIKEFFIFKIKNVALKLIINSKKVHIPVIQYLDLPDKQ